MKKSTLNGEWWAIYADGSKITSNYKAFKNENAGVGSLTRRWLYTLPDRFEFFVDGRSVKQYTTDDWETWTICDQTMTLNQ